MVYVDLIWKKTGKWRMPGDKVYTKRKGIERGTELPPNYARLILKYSDSRGNEKSENILMPALKANGWSKLSKFRLTLLKQKLGRIKYFDLNELETILKV